MADKKISALTEGTTLANDDLLVSVDVSDLTDAPTGTTKKITKANLVTDLESSLNHDSLTGFVANEHIDHSSVSITPNTGLVGGGDLTASRTISMDISTLTDTASPTATDEIAIDTASGMRKSDLQAAVNAAGAVMNSDTSTADMSFVVDEDDMVSDSATKVPTQQSVVAYVQSSLGITSTFTAGESITSGDWVSVGDQRQVTVHDQTAAAFDNQQQQITATTNWHAESFTTAANTKILLSVQLQFVGSGNGTGVVSIQGDSSSNPNGTDINGETKSATINPGGVQQTVTFTFDTPIPVSPSTTYWIVFRFSSISGTVNMYGNGSANDVTERESTNSGSTWVNNNGAMWSFVGGSITELGKIYKASASTNNELANNIIGPATESISQDATGEVQVSNIYTTSGLTAGKTYYLQNTAGTIGTTAGSQSRRVGTALSATELLIKTIDNV